MKSVMRLKSIRFYITVLFTPFYEIFVVREKYFLPQNEKITNAKDSLYKKTFNQSKSMQNRKNIKIKIVRIC